VRTSGNFDQNIEKTQSMSGNLYCFGIVVDRQK